MYPYNTVHPYNTDSRFRCTPYYTVRRYHTVNPTMPIPDNPRRGLIGKPGATPPESESTQVINRP